MSAAHKIRLARIVREAGGCPTPALYKHDPAGTVLLPLCALPVQTDAFGNNVPSEPTDLARGARRRDARLFQVIKGDGCRSGIDYRAQPR